MTSSLQIVQEKNEGFLKHDVKSINANSIHSTQLYIIISISHKYLVTDFEGMMEDIREIKCVCLPP